jgi:hypothetical protein
MVEPLFGEPLFGLKGFVLFYKRWWNLYLGFAFSGSPMALLLLALYGIKVIAVGMQFLELKKAHAFWKTLLLAFVVSFTAAISMMY